jgi:hypothetical protein
MSLLQLNLKPSARDLRWFAGVGFPLFWSAVGWMLFRHGHVIIGAAVWIGAGMLGAAGVARPSVIRPVYFAMMRAAFPSGWVLSYLVLILAFFLILTPIGWLMRLFHDPMQRSFERRLKSYWVPWESSDSESYFRQM